MQNVFVFATNQNWLTQWMLNGKAVCGQCGREGKHYNEWPEMVIAIYSGEARFYGQLMRLLGNHQIGQTLMAQMGKCHKFGVSRSVLMLFGLSCHGHGALFNLIMNFTTDRSTHTHWCGFILLTYTSHLIIKGRKLESPEL